MPEGQVSGIRTSGAYGRHSPRNTPLRDSHSVREPDADGDNFIDAGHLVSWVLEGMSDRIVHFTLLSYLFCL